MERLIITAAVTGSLPTRAQNPNIPYTPEEIATQAIESWEAGASVVHLHVRDPATGRPTHSVALFEQVITIIRERCDVIINTSTGGGPGMSLEDRIGIIPTLASDSRVKPEMASLNCGSVNFGLLNRKTKEWVLNDVQMNPWVSMHHFAETMKAHDVKPELEIYEAGMINNANVLHSLDALKAPLHFQFVLGVLGGLPATVDNVVFLENSIPGGATWSLCVVGVDIFSIGPVAIATGGNVRVGFEDCLHISKGVPASSNAELVSKMVRISREMGREVATPAEARRILGL
jgi:3-keto-5-aminohexanoate cleavage enzyme